MDLQTLKFFYTVATEGSISSAAHKLHYAQSNLSTKITKLEEELQTTLFYRNNQGVTLTPKGELLLKYAADLLNLANEAIEAVNDDGSANGKLTIGSMESSAISYLPKFLTAFHQENSNVSIIVETGTTAYLIDKVLDYSLDGAFISGPLKHQKISSKFVCSDKLVLITNCSLAQEKNYDSLLQQPLLVFPEGCSYRKVLQQWLANENLVPTQIFEFNTLSAILANVSAGLGIALLPKSVVDNFKSTEALILHNIPKELETVQTFFIYRNDTYISSTMKNFLATIS